MARTKIKRRSYNKVNPDSDNTLRETESSRIEEPVQDIAGCPPQSENDPVSDIPARPSQSENDPVADIPASPRQSETDPVTDIPGSPQQSQNDPVSEIVEPPQSANDPIFSPLPHSPVENSPVLNAPDRTTPIPEVPWTSNDPSELAAEAPPSPISFAQTSPQPGTSHDDIFRLPQPSTSTSGYWAKQSNWARPGCSKDRPICAFDYPQPSTSYDREYMAHYRPHSPIFPVPGSSRDSAYYRGARTSSYSLSDHEYMTSGTPVNLVWNSSLLGRGHENPYISSLRSMEDIPRRTPSPPVNLSWNSPIIVQPGRSRDFREDISTPCPSPPLNLAWGNKDIKENSHNDANDAMYRPKTPDMNNVDVDTIFSPNTKNELRTSIRNLFPNGPPLQAVRPMRRPKKGDTPYIVGCTKRPRVPSPQCLTVFKGDRYGLPDVTSEDYPSHSPAKRNRRAPYGAYNVTKSRFNIQCNEIADRLRSDNIELIRRDVPIYVPRTSTVTSRSFSPLPSTSTDHETIRKNDRHFTESISTIFKPDDDDDDLPEIYWGSNSAYGDFSTDSKAIPLVVNKNVKVEEKEKADDCNNPIVIEDANNNNNNNNNENENNTSGDYECCEIQFDKFISKEKIIHYSDDEVVNTEPEEVPEKEPEEKPREEPEVIDTIDIRDYDGPRSPPVPPSASSADVICIDDVNDNNKAQNAQSGNEPNSNTTESTNSSEGTSTSSRSSTNDKNENDGAGSTSAKVPFYQYISHNEQEDIFDYLRDDTSASASNSNNSTDMVRTNQVNLVINVPDEADISEPTSNQDVEFVNEITINGVRYPFEPIRPASVGATDEGLNGIGGTIRAQRRDRKRRGIEADDRVIVLNNENSEPTGNGTSTMELEIVDALPEPNGPPPEAKSPKNVKNLGDCPICLDRLSTGCIASTNCGHVFCLDCIKKSLSTSGKKCPTCRKQLKGTGYHQVYL